MYLPSWLLVESLLLLLGFHTYRVDALPSSSHALARRQIYDANVVHIDGGADDHKKQFFTYVTRPDIDAPRWSVKNYDKDALSSGYWFMATYEMVAQKEGDQRAWVGPHIYDGNGGLIWSGAPMFHGYNIKDFRVASVRGTDMLTGLYTREGEAVLVDSTYTLKKEVKIGEGTDQNLNIHGFNTVFNGTKALAMTQKAADATREELDGIGHDGDCKIIYPGFEEFDTSTWNRTFDWNSEGHIHLNESYADKTCGNKWDFLHANSIDKFPDGDFLYSGRHSDTVYKISGKDGSIVWRLAGRGGNSDFEFSDHFSGQHDARVRSQNETHIVISLLDNAIRPGKPHITNDRSRGMLVLLQTQTRPMTAEVLQTYDHPHADYAPGRGNMQIMDNQNVFMAWWNHSLQSEYSPDGRLLMEARWKAELKSYRSYKFPWVGRPSQPPDVHSEAIALGNGTEPSVSTVVYVSWNGATEVAEWKLYKTTKDGQTREEVASVPRQGFETMLLYHGYAQNVVVEALDRRGDVLGASEVVESVPPAQKSLPQVIAEQDWIQSHSGTNKDGEGAVDTTLSFLSNPIAAYICGIITCAVVVLVVGTLRRSKRQENSSSWWKKALSQSRNHKYKAVSESEEELAEK